MGEVLRLPRRRRHKVKWSAKRVMDRVEITVEWRTPDRAGCMVRAVTLFEWELLNRPGVHFWALIEYMRDTAASRGARF